MLVLGTGLLLAQLLSAAINVAERDRLVAGSFGLQPAQRIAGVVTLLDGLGASERGQVVAVLNQPPLVLSLHDAPRIEPDGGNVGWRRTMFASRLQAALGDDRAVRVQARDGFSPSAVMPAPFASRARRADGAPGATRPIRSP